jgi:hypothetical protein
MRRVKVVVKWVLMGLGVLMLALIVAGVAHRLSRPSEEERVESAIRLASTSGDPKLCDSLNTEGYLEQTTGESAPFAKSRCRQNVESGDSADAVEISHVRVEGGRATATAALRGGAYDGTIVTVRLVEVDGDWKLDRLLAIDRFDEEGFLEALRRDALAAGWSPAAASCAASHLRRLPTASLERRALRGRPDPYPRIAVTCDRPKVEEAVLAAIGGTRLRSPSRTIECARRHMRPASDSRIAAIGFRAEAYGQLLLSCDSHAPFDNMRAELLEHEYLSPAEAACVIRRARGLSRQAAFRLAFEDDRYDSLIEGCET